LIVLVAMIGVFGGAVYVTFTGLREFGEHGRIISEEFEKIVACDAELDAQQDTIAAIGARMKALSEEEQKSHMGIVMRRSQELAKRGEHLDRLKLRSKKRIESREKRQAAALNRVLKRDALLLGLVVLLGGALFALKRMPSS
jgi:hypothetical protein